MLKSFYSSINEKSKGGQKENFLYQKPTATVVLVTALCWWLDDVGNRIIILVTVFVMLVTFSI